MEKSQGTHVALLYTYNRPELLGRSIRSWLDQEYEDKILCIFNNAPYDIKLGGDLSTEISNKGIVIVNSHVDLNRQPYNNLGTIFNHGLISFRDELKNSTFVSMWQDDDIYFPQHLNMCYKFDLNTCKVLKPKYFYYFDKGNNFVKVDENNVEGSWVIKTEFLLEHGFEEPSGHPESKLYQHLTKGVDYISYPDLPITYVYEWNNGVYHSSGNMNHPNNFNIYREKNNVEQRDIVVWSSEKLDDYIFDNVLWLP